MMLSLVALQLILATAIAAPVADMQVHVLPGGQTRINDGPPLTMAQLKSRLKSLSSKHCLNLGIAPDKRASHDELMTVYLAVAEFRCPPPPAPWDASRRR